jgi:signal transduction histidine kinase
LSIVDEGKGIPEDFVNSIFEVSKRLELSGSPQGAGLGLSICKSVVDSVGGKIWIESKEGRGTTVFIAWPKPK